MADLRECIAVALESHGDQQDKAGAPYLVHVACVALGVPRRYAHIGWLHDVVEDDWQAYAPTRSGAIGAIGVRCRLTVNEERALALLTRHDGQRYSDHILRIAQAKGEAGKIARLVKMADLKDNLGRLGELDQETQARLRPRYEQAIAVLPAEAPL